MAADASMDPLAAPLLNDLGRTFTALDQPLDAIAAFADAARLAAPEQHGPLRVIATLNLARTAVDANLAQDVQTLLSEAAEQIAEVTDVTLRARLRLSLGSVLRDASLHANETALREASFDAISTARDDAVAAGDPSLEAHALRLIGALYADEGRAEAALDYSREAAMLAQKAGDLENLYRAQWQSAQSLRIRGQDAAALATYRAAADSLADVRLKVSERSHQSFRDEVAPLYFEYADLLLADTAARTGERAQAGLREARDALEQLRVAEVEDYFQDECAVDGSVGLTLDESEEVAFLYPVVFADRVELLFARGGQFTQVTSAVDAATLNRTAHELRVALEDPASGEDFRRHAETLHAWIAGPLDDRDLLDGVETLVVVPGGVLRTIPIGVLHDGGRFLVERVSVVTSPGLSLTSADTERQARDAYVQINGLTRTVRGFPALPHVAGEIDAIASRFAADVNVDDAFVADTVENDLADRPYNIVHIATHGQFHRDPRRSFLLAHDDLITMDRLESILSLRSYVSESVDLLFLSACQTAAGDERAALGLAGAAASSGADSVVASLWLINDESTATFVEAFYAALEGGSDKADALQRAQLSLLGTERYEHPNYWAPFVLVGSWR
jgi:CHAT domain-containing protein